MAAILARQERRNRYGSARPCAPRERRLRRPGGALHIRRRLRIVAALALLVLLGTLVASAPAHAQAGPGAISMRVLRDLDFGRFAASSAAAGAVTISAAGMRGSAGGVVLLASNNPGPASFHVSASGPAQAVSVSLPADGSVELASGARRMRVSQFRAWPGAFAALADGGATVAVGATLEVAAGQGAGAYAGAFSITVNYE